MTADVISHKPSAIPMVVKEWWVQFDKAPAAAVGKLTNMMIEVKLAVRLMSAVPLPYVGGVCYICPKDKYLTCRSAGRHAD